MPHYLVAESETPDEREQRRKRAGKSSGETYADTLRQMAPGADIDVVAPADADARRYSRDELASFDAVFLTGSPMHVYDRTPEVERQLAFMRDVFEAGVPSFGSCAGLQIAVAAIGGRVHKRPDRMEAGISRRIVATEAGRDHPLLAGRPATWDAAAIHGDAVAELPDGATLLAGNEAAPVQAAEIRWHGGLFWGVQYHPELSLEEMATSLEEQAADLVEIGLARHEHDVTDRARLMKELNDDPDSRPLRWMLGVDDELAVESHRRREIANFIAFVRDRAAGSGADAVEREAEPVG